MTVLMVTGSRDWPERLRPLLEETLDRFCDWDVEPFTLIEGGARGADRQASFWASESRAHPHDYRFRHLIYAAKWQEHDADWCPGCVTSYCVGAGARRNAEMVERGKPTVVVAFKCGFDRAMKKGGTEDAVRRSLLAGIPTWLLDPNRFPTPRLLQPVEPHPALF